MKILCLVLGDQLSRDISSLSNIQKGRDIILMCEVKEEARYVKHHKKKIVFLFSAMRHFADELRESGYSVDYIKFDDTENIGSLKGEVGRALKRHKIDKVAVTHPGEYRVLKDISTWETDLGIPVEVVPDNRFVCTLDEFRDWAKDRAQLRMEYFYREMRRKCSILMDGNEPIGGKWNYDAENRKPPKSGLSIPATYSGQIDAITREVIQVVADYFPDHFGDIEPFHFAVTRDHALQALQKFVEQRLGDFGDYQDAMIEGEPWMYHSQIGLYLNCGLLSPIECVEAAESAYLNGTAAINAVEGFVRQIIGWREYIRGLYWTKMPELAEENFFEASRELPDFYWTANTQMNCLRQCVLETRQNAYAHHIQRLMVLGNFALLAGIDPKQVNEWFLIVYVDAYEWVELPNVSGMALYADGGVVASKPYAASGGYINKMSNYCNKCSFKVREKNGPTACPFNYIYWDFLERNRDKLKSNYRMRMMYNVYDKMDSDRKAAIENDSRRFFRSLTVAED